MNYYYNHKRSSGFLLFFRRRKKYYMNRFSYSPPPPAKIFPLAPHLALFAIFPMSFANCNRTATVKHLPHLPDFPSRNQTHTWYVYCFAPLFHCITPYLIYNDACIHWSICATLYLAPTTDQYTNDMQRSNYTMSTTYNLGSSNAVCAPGIVRWAINGAKFKADRNACINVVASTWSIPESAARALLLEEVPFEIVENEVVRFSVSN